MITESETLKLMMVVSACHHRTAPRMDDRDVALATAKIWAGLLADQGFTLAEYVAAVKKRAKVLSDAPEPADIIRVARATRAEANERETDEEREARQDALARKIAPEVKAITKRATFGPVRSTPRLNAARDTLDNCNGKRDSQTAIGEYLAALAEARATGGSRSSPAIPEAAKIAAARAALDVEASK